MDIEKNIKSEKYQDITNIVIVCIIILFIILIAKLFFYKDAVNQVETIFSNRYNETDIVNITSIKGKNYVNINAYDITSKDVKLINDSKYITPEIFKSHLINNDKSYIEDLKNKNIKVYDMPYKKQKEIMYKIKTKDHPIDCILTFIFYADILFLIIILNTPIEKENKDEKFF